MGVDAVYGITGTVSLASFTGIEGLTNSITVPQGSRVLTQLSLNVLNLSVSTNYADIVLNYTGMDFEITPIRVDMDAASEPEERTIHFVTPPLNEGTYFVEALIKSEQAGRNVSVRQANLSTILLDGIVGETGAQGNTGIQGEPGGDTGYQGVTGYQGITGLDGIQGTTGIQGITGITAVFENVEEDIDLYSWRRFQVSQNVYTSNNLPVLEFDGVSTGYLSISIPMYSEWDEESSPALKVNSLIGDLAPSSGNISLTLSYAGYNEGDNLESVDLLANVINETVAVTSPATFDTETITFNLDKNVLQGKDYIFLKINNVTTDYSRLAIAVTSLNFNVGIASGPTGMIGFTGIQGETGAQGTTGLQGVPGGATGYQGITGFNGITGSIGAAGATGAQGDTGPQGIQGDPGGPTGLQGLTGVQGETGPQGLIGFTGLVGPTGIQGTTGIQGIGETGLQGTTGLIGATGIQGTTGIQGLGETGLIGATGFQGVTGIQGIQGTTGLGATGLEGPTGIQGTTGVEGLGATGIQGSTGAQGVTGVAISSEIAYNNVVRYQVNSSPNIFVASSGSVFNGLSWSRSTVTCTITHTGHGLTTGDCVLVRNVNEDYIYSSVTVVDPDSFSITVANTGDLAGSSAAYLGAVKASSISSTGVTLETPTDTALCADVQILSVLAQTGVRTGTTNYSVIMPTSLKNGAGLNDSINNSFFPVFRVQNETGGSIVLASMTLDSGNPDIFTLGNLGNSNPCLIRLDF
jgi:hypothetical protein